MNSKEALEILFASYYYDGNYQDVIEAREKLEKDLEVLKLLKRWLYDRTDSTLGFKTYANLDNPENINDYIKIKEWLEDEI